MKSHSEAMRLGEEALQAEDYPRALMIFDAVATAHVDDVESMIGAAIAHSRLGNIGTAIRLFTYATELHPDLHMTWGNLGMALRLAGHTGMSRTALMKALEIKADSAEVLSCLAGTYVNDGNPQPGVAFARKALALNPNDSNALNNLALCLMELGKWSEAWPVWRRRLLPGHAVRQYPGTRWEGEEVENLIVHGEQGMGDEIMFLGCLTKLADRVRGNIVIECAPRLVPVLAGAFPRSHVIGREEDFEWDMLRPGSVAWCRMGDLPEFCGVPPRVSGYLKAPYFPAYSDAVLLAFKGGTRRSHEELRNPPREALAVVVDAIRRKGWRPVSIQYGPGGAEMAAEIGIEHDERAASDLESQATAIRSARALVSVQQTALHLGGALGADVLGIIGSKPAWRYGLSGSMPWYETVALFRQQVGEDWAPALGRVAQGIEALDVRAAA